MVASWQPVLSSESKNAFAIILGDPSAELLMNASFYSRVGDELAAIAKQGLTKPERVLLSSQGPVVNVQNSHVEGGTINLCANNYLGLAADSRVVAAAVRAMRSAERV